MNNINSINDSINDSIKNIDKELLKENLRKFILGASVGGAAAGTTMTLASLDSEDRRRILKSLILGSLIGGGLTFGIPYLLNKYSQKYAEDKNMKLEKRAKLKYFQRMEDLYRTAVRRAIIKNVLMSAITGGSLAGGASAILADDKLDEEQRRKKIKNSALMGLVLGGGLGLAPFVLESALPTNPYTGNIFQRTIDKAKSVGKKLTR